MGRWRHRAWKSLSPGTAGKWHHQDLYSGPLLSFLCLLWGGWGEHYFSVCSCGVICVCGQWVMSPSQVVIVALYCGPHLWGSEDGKMPVSKALAGMWQKTGVFVTSCLLSAVPPLACVASASPVGAPSWPGPRLHWPTVGRGSWVEVSLGCEACLCWFECGDPGAHRPCHLRMTSPSEMWVRRVSNWCGARSPSVAGQRLRDSLRRSAEHLFHKVLSLQNDQA